MRRLARSEGKLLVQDPMELADTDLFELKEGAEGFDMELLEIVVHNLEIKQCTLEVVLLKATGIEDIEVASTIAGSLEVGNILGQLVARLDGTLVCCLGC